jgi:hypothetical protein
MATIMVTLTRIEDTVIYFCDLIQGQLMLELRVPTLRMRRL